MSRAAGACWALAGWVCLAGCGDALSSLDSVQRSTRQTYQMTLAPDFARRGQMVDFELSLEPALTELLQAPAPA